MLQFDRKKDKGLDDETIIPVDEYLNVEVKEEMEEEKEYESSDMENDTPHPPPSGNIIVPEFINVEIKELDDSLESEEKVFSEIGSSEKITKVSKDFERHQKSQTDRIEQIYSYLHPSHLNVSNLQTHQAPVVQQIRRGKQRVLKDSYLLFHFQHKPWEIQKILKRREENRKRKALQRAQETEEQRNSRREKERLAKAVSRATEPQEKRMVRRERDRIAKAISRAAESEEQRRTRREKNRVAMAALRAAQTEEERFIRREKDRIKKATLRAFETDEQKRMRREKNRIAMAIRRANLSKQQRAYLRNVNRIAKAGPRGTEEQTLRMMEDVKLPKDSSERESGFEDGENSGEDAGGKGLRKVADDFSFGNPSTSNQSTFISGFS